MNTLNRSQKYLLLVRERIGNLNNHPYTFVSAVALWEVMCELDGELDKGLGRGFRNAVSYCLNSTGNANFEFTEDSYRTQHLIRFLGYDSLAKYNVALEQSVYLNTLTDTQAEAIFIPLRRKKKHTSVVSADQNSIQTLLPIEEQEAEYNRSSMITNLLGTYDGYYMDTKGTIKTVVLVIMENLTAFAYSESGYKYQGVINFHQLGEITIKLLDNKEGFIPVTLFTMLAQKLYGNNNIIEVFEAHASYDDDAKNVTSSTLFIRNNKLFFHQVEKSEDLFDFVQKYKELNKKQISDEIVFYLNNFSKTMITETPAIKIDDFNRSVNIQMEKFKNIQGIYKGFVLQIDEGFESYKIYKIVMNINNNKVHIISESTSEHFGKFFIVKDGRLKLDIHKKDAATIVYLFGNVGNFLSRKDQIEAFGLVDIFYPDVVSNTGLMQSTLLLFYDKALNKKNINFDKNMLDLFDIPEYVSEFYNNMIGYNNYSVHKQLVWKNEVKFKEFVYRELKTTIISEWLVGFYDCYVTFDGYIWKNAVEITENSVYSEISVKKIQSDFKKVRYKGNISLHKENHFMVRQREAGKYDFNVYFKYDEKLFHEEGILVGNYAGFGHYNEPMHGLHIFVKQNNAKNLEDLKPKAKEEIKWEEEDMSEALRKLLSSYIKEV